MSYVIELLKYDHYRSVYLIGIAVNISVTDRIEKALTFNSKRTAKEYVDHWSSNSYRVVEFKRNLILLL